MESPQQRQENTCSLDKKESFSLTSSQVTLTFAFLYTVISIITIIWQMCTEQKLFTHPLT